MTGGFQIVTCTCPRKLIYGLKTNITGESHIFILDFMQTRAELSCFMKSEKVVYKCYTNWFILLQFNTNQNNCNESIFIGFIILSGKVLYKFYTKWFILLQFNTNQNYCNELICIKWYCMQTKKIGSSYLYSTVQYSTVQYSTVQYSTVQYSTVQ